MSWGFELFLNLGFSGRAGVGGMSKEDPSGRPIMGMLAHIARPESNGEVTNVIFLAIFLGRFASANDAGYQAEIEGLSTSSLIQSLAEP